jgi:catechol 2,3-dioxygenase
MHQRISIEPSTHLGTVSLTVADLARSVRFYGDVLGFSPVERSGTAALLSAGGAPLLELVEQPGAWPKPPRTTGLYHFAILVPSRVDLARSLRRLAEKRWPLQGAADHLVSEALYLADPDGNGIEIYRDRPREEWPLRDGQVQMTTDPLDVDGVLGELSQDGGAWEGLPAGTTIGHIHLHVADLRKAEDFYCGILGFDVTQRGYPGALFVSAGGYHHHVGLNIWAGSGAPPQPAGTAGLRHCSVVLPDYSSLEGLLGRLETAAVHVEQRQDGWYLRDLSQNGLRLVVGKERV